MSWVHVFLLKQKMVNKSTFGLSSYTSLSAFLFEVFNFSVTKPDCAFSFHMLRSKSPFFCKLPATHSHLATLSSSFPQKALGVKLAASLGENESACTSGKYIMLFLPSTWIRPKTQVCTIWRGLPWAEQLSWLAPVLLSVLLSGQPKGDTYRSPFATFCQHLKTCNTFNRVWSDELNSFGWNMVLVAQINSLLNSWDKRRSRT